MTPIARLAATMLATVVVGCSSSNPDLYTIAPQPGATGTGAPKVILVRSVSLARYLERPQIVRSSEGYRLDVKSNDWWGEPLPAMLTRILVEELGQRLPDSTVYPESGAVSTRPDAVVEVNVQRMDEDRAGNLVLIAQTDVSVTGVKNSRTRSFRPIVPTSGPTVAAEVAAISVAVGQVADGVAEMLRTP